MAGHALVAWLALAGLLGACGTKPGGPEDEENLLSGRWLFESTSSELFLPTRLILAQSDEDTRALLEGSLFGTQFQRIALSGSAPEAFVFQITFTRLEQAAQYEILTLALDGRLVETDRIAGSYEIRGNLDSGGTLRLETGNFAAVRVTATKVSGD